MDLYHRRAGDPLGSLTPCETQSSFSAAREARGELEMLKVVANCDHLSFLPQGQLRETRRALRPDDQVVG